MTVYVDDMRARVGRMIMCHMIADTDAELHAMADTIKVRRKWFQGDHYDISLDRRRRALAAGAIAITQRQAAAIRANRRCGAGLGSPDTAIQDWRTRVASVSASARAIVEGTP